MLGARWCKKGLPARPVPLAPWRRLGITGASSSGYRQQDYRPPYLGGDPVVCIAPHLMKLIGTRISPRDSFSATISLIRRGPEAPVSGLGGWKRRDPQTMAGMFPPIGELIEFIDGNRATHGAFPVDAFSTYYRQTRVERDCAPLSANIVAVGPCPMCNFIGPVARLGRPTPATPPFLIEAPPKRASFAGRVRIELTHLPTPLSLIA